MLTMPPRTRTDCDRSVILIAYKIRPSTGSEDGSGYHIAARLLRRGCSLTIISRSNNIQELQADPSFSGARLIGVDVPRPLRYIKRGGRGIILYYYFWQIAVARVVSRLLRQAEIDVVHQLNFHADWAPHFLSHRSVVWGPIAHHDVVPTEFYPASARLSRAKDVARSAAKRVFWRGDPFLRRAIHRSRIILYANDLVAPPFASAIPKIRFRPYAGSFATETHAEPDPSDVFRVLFVGRLIPLKGLFPAVESYMQFIASSGASETEFVIVGDGELRDFAAASTRREPSIKLRSWVPQAELADVYRASSVFLFPSYEAQGLVVSEALSFGVPTICVEGTGPAFLVGSAGTVVSRGPKLVVRLTEALLLHYRSWQRGDSAAAKAAARARYRSYLEWDKCVDDILLAYDDATDRSR
jgi:glycosyltransferase involved in cell wall biosynthesis